MGDRESMNGARILHDVRIFIRYEHEKSVM